MRTSRCIPLLLALCLLLPAALAAAEACAMSGCAMVEPEAHGCCPQPEARLDADCCFESAGDPAEPPASAPERAAAKAGVQVAAPVTALAPPRAAAALPPAPATSPPRDLLARHCILRI